MRHWAWPQHNRDLMNTGDNTRRRLVYDRETPLRRTNEAALAALEACKNIHRVNPDQHQLLDTRLKISRTVRAQWRY
ncbi:hypothetical protein AC578_8736 [Pseudocercospora eumusae]|uniref:Uncharacterized protein n=1 Tax=Pseudocercospora eumusae TaxID=321146 RepID=A0A139HQ44_9PEZI|nr:hypothetical protein AC578_8736 [Pseudocercospora eumusae]